jgi:16S rRNA (cytosine1402-N4)-methyltransferase
MHTPVLLQEAVESLDIHKGGMYIDATLGEGGHFQEMVNKGGTVLGIDWDNIQVQKMASQLQSSSSKVVTGNYADIENIATQNAFSPVDGVLFDLGLSMEQLNTGKKGFSYKHPEEPLDMRIGSDTEQTAADLLNTLNKESLYNVFAKYSEELDSLLIASAVEKTRSSRPYETVEDLVNTVQKALKSCPQKHVHMLNKTLARIFQSLRIVVNNEFENIRKGLEGSLKITKKNGRVSIITFHSLEDRVVKQFIRAKQLKFEEIVKGNPELSYEKSATLRVIIVQ